MDVVPSTKVIPAVHGMGALTAPNLMNISIFCRQRVFLGSVNGNGIPNGKGGDSILTISESESEKVTQTPSTRTLNARREELDSAFQTRGKGRLNSRDSLLSLVFRHSTQTLLYCFLDSPEPGPCLSGERAQTVGRGDLHCPE